MPKEEDEDLFEAALEGTLDPWTEQETKISWISPRVAIPRIERMLGVASMKHGHAVPIAKDAIMAARARPEDRVLRARARSAYEDLREAAERTTDLLTALQSLRNDEETDRLRLGSPPRG